MIVIIMSLLVTYILLSICVMAIIFRMNTQDFIDSNISSMPTSWKVLVIVSASILGFLTGPISLLIYATYHLCKEYNDFVNSIKEYIKND